jgi:hypothetical protein
MIVYRADERPCDTAAELSRLIRRAGSVDAHTPDALMELFIDLGELESGIADRQFATRDGLHPLTTALRSAALHSAHALIASSAGEIAGRDRELAALGDALRATPRSPLPAAVALRVPEGYAYYALHPESYALAAREFAHALRPASAICIGIRSIGTSLSAIVAAALERLGVIVSLHTVRPHGHPFDRSVRFDSELAAAFEGAPRDSFFLVVDEGPGLSGSSFGSVARALGDLGIESNRVILFPSWNPDGSEFRSDEARSQWTKHQRFCVGVSAIAQHGEGIDLSGGSWRQVVWVDESQWPAVQPRHEVLKRWIPATGSVVRFAGLGRYGAAKRRRAEALAEAGLGPAPVRLENGYLSLKFLEGRPCTPRTEVTTGLVDTMATHIGFLTRSFPGPRSPRLDTVLEMAAANIRLGLVDAAPPLPLEPFRSALDAAPCAAIDGRMLAHEWLHTGSGFVKTDALDHHCDHFFPGIQDAGWDLAAATFEFDLNRAARDRLLARYVAASGDRDVRQRLPFYDLAYPAFRLGYATLAEESLGNSADARRFAAVADRCRSRLRRLLTSPNAP